MYRRNAEARDSSETSVLIKQLARRQAQIAARQIMSDTKFCEGHSELATGGTIRVANLNIA